MRQSDGKRTAKTLAAAELRADTTGAIGEFEAIGELAAESLSLSARVRSPELLKTTLLYPVLKACARKTESEAVQTV